MSLGDDGVLTYCRWHFLAKIFSSWGVMMSAIVFMVGCDGGFILCDFISSSRI